MQYDSGLKDDNELLYWVAVNEIKGIGSITFRKLLQKLKTPKHILYAPASALKEIEDIGEKTANLIIDSRRSSLEKAKRIIADCQKKNINVLTIKSKLYPYEVKQLKDAPVILYYSGNIRKNIFGIGIVGSRRCSDYGKRVTKEAAEFLAESGVAVISGMAKGTDGYAHSACINANGYTAAFLGSGIDICYPIEHLKLMEKIKETGVLISEYAPGVKPQATNFPKRNRLIAAFSKKLLVIEAGENSGALITASYAKKYGRQIYAVPNNIYDKQSIGSNKLILDGDDIDLLEKLSIMELDGEVKICGGIVVNTSEVQNLPETSRVI
ncbi:DNA-processing protein DprA [Clostridium oryzae]|uniref:Smf/DprA SLOG domain-containing protein n=1 Tax=Clostridium oryzae TaxID=1450648 RepID=A0A1V4IYD1_9CLOT|nr:DNA-processing protein DprA [Clostridium oryzae]OPJ65078.1 hypothetical protein CLORY_00780 [Clostridium oryzae]